MAFEIVTKDDLEIFRKTLLADIRQIIQEMAGKKSEPVEGYKTRHVRQILGCSTNKVIALRVARKIRVKKVGGTLYYNKDDVKRLVNEDF